MKSIELLAPARTADIGIEAIRHGADAVYIGAEAFGARAAAGNSVEDIRRLVEFAHTFRASVYVTVNTILYDHELEAVEKLCWQLYEAQVDALIVQDLQLLSLNLPPIPLHASTQMDNRTVEKVRGLSSLGFNQVVLARELTIEEIAAIHQACPDTLLEVFVHGALCVSLSGLCNISEALFHRSANRGECAQVCRMEMDLLEGDKVLLKDKHLLSLRDNCQLHNLEKLLFAGATSLKIEGRLKDMEYVKNITAAYSQALNAIIAKHPALFRRKSVGHVKYTFQPNVWKSFNRGFVKDVSKPDANILTPKSMGEPITFTTPHQPSATLHNGDGLCYIANDKLVGFRVNNATQFHPVAGIQYYRNQDVEWDRQLSKPSAERRIYVDIEVCADHINMTEETGIRSTVPIHSEPANTPQADNIREQLGKLGNTPYELRQLSIQGDAKLFIPSSQLAAARRTLVKQLEETRSKRNTKSELRITKYELRNTKYELRNTNYEIRITNYESTPHGLSDFGFRNSDFKFRNSDFGFNYYELTHDPSTPLMQTKYCLRRQLGKCLKTQNRTTVQPYNRTTAETQNHTTDWQLRLKNGRLLRLQFDCKQCMMKVFMLSILTLLLSCVGNNTGQEKPTDDTIINIVDTTTIQPDSTLMALTPRQVDSLNFRLKHHYSENFNFVVKADSLTLIPRQGDLLQDTCQIHEGDLIAVAAISQQADTVWLKVAHDQQTMGWLTESQLLEGASPDDPISQMLYTLSSLRGIWMSILAAIGLIAFLIRQRRHQQMQFLKFPSLYPRLFILLIALMAATYATVQNFLPEYWQEYYFHPTLNPLVLPPIMAFLVTIVWLLIITFIAVLDEAYHKLQAQPAIELIIELIGIGMITYLIISWTTLYYIGYLLLLMLIYKVFQVSQAQLHWK